MLLAEAVKRFLRKIWHLPLTRNSETDLGIVGRANVNIENSQGDTVRSSVTAAQHLYRTALEPLDGFSQIFFQIDRIPRNNRGHDQAQAISSMLLILVSMLFS
jgi:hypothetical protein